MENGKEVVLSALLSPEQLSKAIRSADIDPLQLSSKPLMSRMVRVMCPLLCLDIVELGPAMLFTGSMAQDCYTIVLVTRCPSPGRAFNFEIEHIEGYMGFFPPGGRLDAYTPEGYANATLVVSKEVFRSAMERRSSKLPKKLLDDGAGMKIGGKAMLGLTEILTKVEQALVDPRRPLEGMEARRHLEESLLNAFIKGLESGFSEKTQKFGSRTAGRMVHLRQAREFVRMNEHRAISLEELCSAVGMSRRGVEVLFRESLDISPNTFIRNHRLHGVRRALLDGDSDAGVIKESAMKWGFTHMGHFSRSYRELFGECPSETAGR